jgi:hypothetical protein
MRPSCALPIVSHLQQQRIEAGLPRIGDRPINAAP